ncbi:MAG: hypothetical protein A4E24_01665 [Methanomethylovorans sp. PtaU1.Bin093]|uniref:hypothetical protein n=1 Tax=Methanomethylovorans sp. PtaU1.Bin093 TaxID=1811679 RepID=UPI0009CF0BA2|nr:hypothetical protein [Methanomethylovorans sp. PtaU1.Bin093]OPY19419.1 MAG: hypothetical protein A4E24_01665 [Methanomethylovorans sp. PtaU1.Bin093]
MPDIEFSGSRKSKTAAFSLSPNTIKKLEAYSNSEEYGNKSSIVQQAITEFFAREEMRVEKEEYLTSVRIFISEFLQSPEGEALIRSILRKSLAASDEEAAATRAGTIVEHQ